MAATRAMPRLVVGGSVDSQVVAVRGSALSARPSSRARTPGAVAGSATVLPFRRPGAGSGAVTVAATVPMAAVPMAPVQGRRPGRWRLLLAGLGCLLLVVAAMAGRLSLGAAGGTPVDPDVGTGSATVAPAVPGQPVSAGGARPGMRTPDGGQLVPAGWRRVQVGPGDSLWSIARRNAPADDPREVVAAIAARSGLTRGLQAGDTVVVPSR